MLMINVFDSLLFFFNLRLFIVSLAGNLCVLSCHFESNVIVSYWFFSAGERPSQ